MRKLKRILILLAAMLLLSGCGNGLELNIKLSDGNAKNTALDSDRPPAAGEMKVTFLDIGQGDCTLIQANGHNMLMDAGNNGKGSAVVTYLQETRVTRLDYFILSHPDADHIGGGDNVLETIEVENVIMPDVQNDTMTYDEVIDDIEQLNINVIHPNVGDSFELGDARFTILCPEPELVKDSDLNNASVGLKLVHGNKSFVMCGDAEEKSEKMMVKRFGDDLECDVLKCGHHGSATATSDSFLAATNPAWAVISCGESNRYGHPHAEVVSKLEDDDIQIYRTDKRGNITVVSDGTNLAWTSEK